MQLSDRQSSHAQASSTASGHVVSEPVRFKKACSPDIPEPPHKKGSGQRSSGDCTLKQPEHQLRRKVPENVGKRSPTTSPRAPAVKPYERTMQSSAKTDSISLGTPIEKDQISASPPSPARSSLPDLQTNGHKASGKASLFSMHLSSYRTPSSVSGHDYGKNKELASQLKLARLLGSRGNMEGAQGMADKLYTAHPSDPDVLCLRGQCFAALNKRAQACNALLSSQCSFCSGLAPFNGLWLEFGAAMQSPKIAVLHKVPL